MRELIPGYIKEIDPYRPGLPVEEVERELRVRAIKLASNENPLGPSPKAIEAAQASLSGANRYPDGGGYYLRQKLAGLHGVPMDAVILGLGSSELIDLAARALLRPGLKGLTAAGSFPLYRISICAAGATLVEVPLRNYTFDLEAMAEAISTDTRVIYIANPNNPTGTLFEADALAAFLERVPRDVLVVMDEAYYDYVDRPAYTCALEAFRGGQNIFLLRTFSKVHGMAGMRIGYGIGPVDLIEELNKLRTPFNTPGFAQAAALAALDDHEHVQRSVEANTAGKAWLCRELQRLGVAYVPSFTNFVFMEVGPEAGSVCEQLLKRGVIVRPLGWMGFPGAIRVTVGTPEENHKFIEAFTQVRARANSTAR